MSEHETFGERLRRQIQTPGAGARLNAASSGGGGDTGHGTHAEATTRPDEEGRTERLFLLDFDDLDDASTYLGDDPLEEPEP